MSRLAKDEGGFTLVEVLVTVMIMIVVLFALYGIFDMGLRVFAFGNNKVEAVENARLGMERMEREIRAAYPVDRNADDDDRYLFFDANGATSNPPEDMPTATGITFGNDLGSGNGRIECPNLDGDCEYITYKLSPEDASDPNAARSLQRVNTANSGNPGEPVIEFVDTTGPNGGLNFGYFSQNVSGTLSEVLDGDQSKFDIVRITLDIRVQSGQQSATQTLTTDVSLRNRG